MGRLLSRGMIRGSVSQVNCAMEPLQAYGAIFKLRKGNFGDFFLVYFNFYTELKNTLFLWNTKKHEVGIHGFVKKKVAV